MASTIGVDSTLLSSDGRPLLEPGALFVDGSYALRLNAWCSVAGVTIALRSRFLRSDGSGLVNSGDQLALTSARALNTLDVQLAVGFPLNVMVFALAGAPLIGQCFVQVQIVSGVGAGSFPLATVLQGYVTATQALSWPGSPIESAIAGGGCPRVIVGTMPAAGAEVNETVPVNARWMLQNMFLHFQTSAFVANRCSQLSILHGGNRTMISADQSTVPANTGMFLHWAPGMFPYVKGSGDSHFMPWGTTATMLAGDNLVTSTFGFDAADQYSAPTYTVTEWLDV